MGGHSAEKWARMAKLISSKFPYLAHVHTEDSVCEGQLHPTLCHPRIEPLPIFVPDQRVGVVEDRVRPGLDGTRVARSGTLASCRGVGSGGVGSGGGSCRDRRGDREHRGRETVGPDPAPTHAVAIVSRRYEDGGMHAGTRETARHRWLRQAHNAAWVHTMSSGWRQR